MLERDSEYIWRPRRYEMTDPSLGWLLSSFLVSTQLPPRGSAIPEPAEKQARGRESWKGMRKRQRQEEKGGTASAAWRAACLEDPFLLTHKILHAFKNKNQKQTNPQQFRELNLLPVPLVKWQGQVQASLSLGPWVGCPALSQE